MEASPVSDMASAILVPAGKMTSFVDQTPEVVETVVTCPASCFTGTAWETKEDKDEGIKYKPGLKSLLFGKNPFCAPECRMVHGTVSKFDITPAKKNLILA